MSRKPLAISMGEPGGIGLETILKAWLQRKTLKLPDFVLLAPPALVEKRAKNFNYNVPISLYNNEDTSDSLKVIPLNAPVSDKLGTADPHNGKAVIEAIKRGVELVQEGQASALVTNPINKASLYEAGFTFPGHTEFLGALAEHYDSERIFPVMLLAGPELKAVPVTCHIALKDVPSALKSETIIKIANIVEHDFRIRFGIKNPRIAVAGLNPHAGEQGTMGHEDETIIKPAIKTLQARGHNIIGPLPADTMFHASARARYDVALAMYHDQALIPVKTLAFDKTANVTLGLPFVRTSPDHGTALDIATQGIAKPDSLIAAMKMATFMIDQTHVTN